MTTYDKARNGDYVSSMPMPSTSRKLDKTSWQTYDDDKARLIKQFEQDLAEEFGVTGNPKADLLFGKAWEQGHGSGFAEVCLVYADLVDLIR